MTRKWIVSLFAITAVAAVGCGDPRAYPAEPFSLAAGTLRPVFGEVSALGLSGDQKRSITKIVVAFERANAPIWASLRALRAREATAQSSREADALLEEIAHNTQVAKAEIVGLLTEQQKAKLRELSS